MGRGWQPAGMGRTGRHHRRSGGSWGVRVCLWQENAGVLDEASIFGVQRGIGGSLGDSLSSMAHLTNRSMLY